MKIFRSFSVISSTYCVFAQLHFASLGNFALNESNQKEVTSALKKDALKTPYSLIISPGSCFRDGIDSVDDEKWKRNFEDIYKGNELNLSFFPTLGSRDWEYNVTAMVEKTNQTYDNMSYDFKGPRWTIPNFYYHFTQTFTDTTKASKFKSSPEISVFFVFIDTMILQPTFAAAEYRDQHWKDLFKTIESATKIYDWVILVGDEAIYSSGSSGNSKYLSKFLRPLLKDKLVDAYISGKDANMEIIEDGTLLHVNCGAAGGGSAGKFLKHENNVAFSSDTGYCRHILTQDSFITEFISTSNNKVLATYKKSRNHKPEKSIKRAQYHQKIPKVEFKPLPPGVGGSPGGEVITTFADLFILIFGSTGLIIFSSIVVIAGTTVNFRAGKWIYENSKTIKTPINMID